MPKRKIKSTAFTSDTTKKIAELAKLTIDKKEQAYLTKQFIETLKVVDQLNKLHTQKTIETSQVTGLINVFRKDFVDKDRILSQKQALYNAKRVHNGFFVVKAIFDNES